MYGTQSLFGVEKMCGINMIILKKDLEYYIEKYKTPSFLADKGKLMLLKGRNRAQGSTGTVSLEILPPDVYGRRRIHTDYVKDIVKTAHSVDVLVARDWRKHSKSHIIIGQERYETKLVKLLDDFDEESRYSSVQPIYLDAAKAYNRVVLAFNGNWGNNEQQRMILHRMGVNLESESDVEAVGKLLKQLILDETISMEAQGCTHEAILRGFPLDKIVGKAAAMWKGAYAMVGFLGNGIAFAFRDEYHIRPLWMFENDEILVFASETCQITEAFQLTYAQIQNLRPVAGGHIIIKRPGEATEEHVFAGRGAI